MTAGKGNDVLSACLCSVIAYAKIHFASEERLMQKHQYPEYAQHKEAHDQLAARVVQFQTDLKASRTALNIQLMVVLRDWLTDHIAQNDRKLAEYLRRNAA
jgi:hemerythrin-like metal-binding protein